MTYFPYVLKEDPRPCLGLIVLQSDETIEDDFRRLFAPTDVRLHITRVTSGVELNAETFEAMEADLPAAATKLPRSVEFDVVGYACTSGATVIGADRVCSLVQSGCRTQSVTNPLSAAIAAIKSLALKRVGIVSPYVHSVADQLRTTFENNGIEVPAMLSFGEDTETNVARIVPASLKDAARALVKKAQIDGVFLSCTNLRTLDIIDALEAELGVPVLSSNQALAWHFAQLSSRDVGAARIGRLMSQ